MNPNRSRAIFLSAIFLVIMVFSSTLYAGLASGEINRTILKPLKSQLVYLQSLPEKIAEQLVEKSQPEAANNTPANPSFSPTPTTAPLTNPPPPRPCYRYSVTHLDGSTSNLCYSQSDYNSLVNLGYSLSTAKTFYQFQLDGAQRYQDEYDRTHSSIYLDAKASSEQQAKRENDKIGSITLQMQQIEQRGY